MPDSRTDAREAVRAALGDAAELCHKLRLDNGAQRQAGGLVVRCPWCREQARARRSPGLALRLEERPVRQTALALVT